jgi:hypothetical protein
MEVFRMPNRLLLAGPNSKYQQPGAEPAGFWIGFWHGIIMPITFIVSLFNPDVGIYETNNNGGLYNFGFVIGATGSGGTGGAATRTQ